MDVVLQLVHLLTIYHRPFENIKVHFCIKSVYNSTLYGSINAPNVIAKMHKKKNILY